MGSPAQNLLPAHDFIPRKMSDPDPTGTGLMGWSPDGVDLTRGAVRPVIHYRGRHGEAFLTADVYAPQGLPRYILITCPVCENALTIKEDRKAFELDLERTPRFPGFVIPELLIGLGLPHIGPLLSMEPIRCTWESEPSLRRGFGLGICTFSVAITHNIARDV